MNHLTRLTAGLAAVALAVLVLAGCGSTSSLVDTVAAAQPTEAAPTAPAPEPPTHTTLEQVYLDTLAAENIRLGSDAHAIEVGHGVCDVLESGYTFAQVGNVIVETGNFTPYQAGYIVGAAAGAFCPAQMPSSPGTPL